MTLRQRLGPSVVLMWTQLTVCYNFSGWLGVGVPVMRYAHVYSIFFASVGPPRTLEAWGQCLTHEIESGGQAKRVTISYEFVKSVT